jgi:hypothetical protein
MASYHIAQYNVARMRAELDDPIMHGFASRLDDLNHLADRTPGFVWRHTASGEDTSTSLRLYPDDPLVVINMSVWETIEALHAYAYRSDHGPMYAARHTWFEPMPPPTLVLWWVPAGHEPEAAEGRERLELLQRAGPTAEAFTFKRRFPPPAD